MGAAAVQCKCVGGEEGSEAPGEEPAMPAGDEDLKAKNAQKEKMAEAKKKMAIYAKNLRVRVTKEQNEAWKKVESEYAVQVMIWQSMSLQRGAKHQGVSASLQSKIEYAISVHASNLDSALEALDVALEKNRGYDLLGSSMSEAVNGIRASKLKGEARKALATILDSVAEEPGEISPGDTDLQKMLSDCKLEDSKMENGIKAAWKLAHTKLS